MFFQVTPNTTMGDNNSNTGNNRRVEQINPSKKKKKNGRGVYMAGTRDRDKLLKRRQELECKIAVLEEVRNILSGSLDRLRDKPCSFNVLKSIDRMLENQVVIMRAFLKEIDDKLKNFT